MELTESTTALSSSKKIGSKWSKHIAWYVFKTVST